MSVYSIANLSSAKAFVDVLENDINDITNLSNEIKNFHDTSIDILKGESWDLIRKNLNDYITILEMRKNVASSLIDVINSVNNKLLLALGDYPEINTDYLDEQQRVYDQCQNEIANIDNSTSEKKDTLKEYQDLMDQANKMINQINQVMQAEKSSLSELEQIGNSLINYSSKVDEIPVPVISYTEVL